MASKRPVARVTHLDLEGDVVNIWFSTKQIIRIKVEDLIAAGHRAQMLQRKPQDEPKRN